MHVQILLKDSPTLILFQELKRAREQQKKSLTP